MTGFDLKKISNYNFFKLCQILVWIQIRIGSVFCNRLDPDSATGHIRDPDSAKYLNPDPDSMNTVRIRNTSGNRIFKMRILRDTG